MERIIHRQFVGDVNTEFNVQDQEDIPEDCLTTRGDDCDAHTLDRRVGPGRQEKVTPKYAMNVRKTLPEAHKEPGFDIEPEQPSVNIEL